jgi:fibronectin-binding autotransporter adhesin
VSTAVIQSTGGGGVLTKAGNGTLSLNAQNTFSGGVNITAGAVLAGVSSTITAGSFASGPFGTGALTLSSDSARLVGVATTVYNPVTVSNPGNILAIGGVASNNLTLNGAITFGTGTRNIQVDSPVVVGTLGAALTGGTGFTKTGPGILALANPANLLTGTITVSDGVLRPAVANAFSPLGRINVGTLGTFDLNALATVIGSLSGEGLVTNNG